jgi:hypothetical protein
MMALNVLSGRVLEETFLVRVAMVCSGMVLRVGDTVVSQWRLCLCFTECTRLTTPPILYRAGHLFLLEAAGDAGLR